MNTNRLRFIKGIKSIKHVSIKISIIAFVGNNHLCGRTCCTGCSFSRVTASQH